MREKKISPQSAVPAGPVGALVPALLRWFRRSARDLPWRRTRDPYAIWVSEIMLQQTQVKTVIPYWERWMKALPTIAVLAQARPERVLKLWEGLGYYSRARNLHRAAQLIVTTHGGRFPEKLSAALALPGIGRYTAGAIASIAFDQPAPILDGNVMRVLARLFAIDGDPRARPTQERLWKLAEQLVQHAATRPRAGAPHCSHLNQSLMELGALICTPRQPQCSECPVRPACRAHQQGRVAELPRVARRVAATPRRFVAVVLERAGSYLVRQRPGAVVNAHLWEFPNREVRGDASDPAAVALELFGRMPGPLLPLGTIKHSITRYRITLEVFRVPGTAATPRPDSTDRWATPAELQRLAFTSAHKKILDRLG